MQRAETKLREKGFLRNAAARGLRPGTNSLALHHHLLPLSGQQLPSPSCGFPYQMESVAADRLYKLYFPQPQSWEAA